MVTPLEVAIRAKSRELGFDAVGFARADEPLDVDHERYLSFLAGGLHGTMEYLAESRDVRRRVDTEDILAGARTVIAVARSYRRHPDAEASDPPIARRVARYARGSDYHNGMRRSLRRLAAYVRTLPVGDGHARARPMLDDVPVLERAWAARAGLGFVGKNGMLIVPGRGSYVLLGEVVTDLELAADAPMAERCGSCTLCLDACPTQAFVRPFVLDARRCVAYLTIELRGPVPTELRAGVGEHLFGCDDCQTVCPFNAARHEASRAGSFAPLPMWAHLTEQDLLGLDAAAWSALSLGSPTKRAELEGMARNAALVLGNRRAHEARAVLVSAAEQHPSLVVRDAAAWALGVLDRPDAP